MYKLNINSVLKNLKTSATGLTEIEADKRVKKYGKNEISKQKKDGFFICFIKQFLNIMVGILLLSAIVSISLAVINKEYSDLFEGFVILFIVVMNALIGVFQEKKAEACLNDLQKYERKQVCVVRNGEQKLIDSSLVTVGDIVCLNAGNVVCADIRLIETNNFLCDESLLTGESVPVEKDAEFTPLDNLPIAERKNMAYSGSMVLNGKATGVVVKIGNETETGKIASMLTKSKKETTPLQKSIDKIGKIITWVVLFVCAIVFSIELISGHGVKDAILLSVALAVAAIPESLPAVITIIMALGVQQLAKRRCIIRHLLAVETLGSCEIICTDKTGTLTMNKMQVNKIFCDNNYCNGNTDVLECMHYCNNCKIENDVVVGESTEKALFEFGLNFKFEDVKKIKEIPFDSKRKMMTVVLGGKNKSYTKGAPDFLIKKCKYIKINGKIQDFDSYFKEKIKNINNEMTDKALRVIALCEKTDISLDEELEENLTFLGLVGLMDKPRPEVKKSIEKCFNAGLKPIMITGDHKRTAYAIAHELGIAKSVDEVVVGEQLDKMTDKELKQACKTYSVFARVSPEHKVRIVKAFKNLNKIVAMTGDGVNDAPSLKIADIGVGMGKSGTDVVKSVADILVTDDNFSSIVVAVEEGRKVYSNIQKALQFLISTNCVEVFGMLIALMCFPKYTFLLPAQMLFINLVTDSLPAFALGVEKVEKEVMAKPPRNPKAGLFSGSVGVAIIYQSILQTAIVMIVFLIGVFCYSPAVASSMVFFTIIYMQLLHSLNCKTNGSLLERKWWDNKIFNICFLITLSLNLMVSCVPIMYKIFNLSFLNLSQWIVVIIASILIIPACELIKAILLQKNQKLILEKKPNN